ncbi:hypothetical protein FUAX_34150 [Fulvitalea axinellae]|uniref:Transposase IS30-like HTH domain-containing protein n=1 Tax=Fulvitalea axinellae TaxID=1182444 RepID=A0AAU9CS91_9BACT|nr:hypothetical protein FUAX_34150 [Fulvitalea axinellae]
MRATESKEKPHLYRHLSVLERRIIHNLKLDGYSLRKIATTLGRSPSTVSRELRRNKTFGEYFPGLADDLYTARKRLYAICFRRPARRGWRYVPGERHPRNEIAWLSDLGRYRRLGRKFLPKRWREKAPSIYPQWKLKPYNFSDLPYYEWMLTLEEKVAKHAKAVDKLAESVDKKQKFLPKTDTFKKLSPLLRLPSRRGDSGDEKIRRFSTSLWKTVA